MKALAVYIRRTQRFPPSKTRKHVLTRGLHQKHYLKKRRFDCALICCKAHRRQLEHERNVGGNTRRSRLFLLTFWILTVMPVRFYYSSFLVFFLSCFWTRNNAYFASVSCVWVFWHGYKPFFWIGSFVTTCRLTCSEISLLIFKQRKKLERSPGNGRTMY